MFVRPNGWIELFALLGSQHMMYCIVLGSFVRSPCGRVPDLFLISLLNCHKCVPWRLDLGFARGAEGNGNPQAVGHGPQ